MTLKHLFLTGFRGTGKSACGKLLGSMLGIEVVDLDAAIENRANRTIAEIFKEFGEIGFRERESFELQLAIQSDAKVISLGGGAILRPKNRELIAQSGKCAWLVASAETIVARLAADRATASQRPSLTTLSTQDEVIRLLKDREPLYKQVADFTVDTDGKTPEEVAIAILEWFRSLGRFPLRSGAEPTNKDAQA